VPKIAFIGAGSFGFTRTLVKDILTFPLLENSELALMDIDEERLDYIRRAVERIVREGGYPATVTATTNRKEALKGADGVLVTILAGGVQRLAPRHRDPTEIRRQHQRGRHAWTLGRLPRAADDPGDARHRAAIWSSYARGHPAQLHQPNGNALPRDAAHIIYHRDSGLCHSVQGTAAMLANWIGAPMDEIDLHLRRASTTSHFSSSTAGTAKTPIR
jgi:alpha-galactosidase